MVVVVEVSHKPSKCLIMLEGKQAENSLLKACAITFKLEWVFPSKAIEMFVGGLRKGPSLVLCFLANMLLDASVQPLDSRVEGLALQR